MGNHHDAWTFGAMDPLSGSASITELTRIFGLMLKSSKHLNQINKALKSDK
jgi:N-acetylated-alpha-linked acidic dipeptidase